MLLSMQPPTSAVPAISPRSFAGLLAAIALPDKTIQPESDLDEGDEDLASLSYEQALRSHTPFHPVSAKSQPGLPPALDSLTSVRTADRRAVGAGSGPLGSTKPQGTNTPLQSGRRCSSVTVRLSAPESDQLHLRAAEAGLTVSAYLRSCAFEVESLRAEVKTTLSQLRSLNATKQEPIPSGKLRSWLHFFKLPNRPQSQR
jgi:hypothetical protein